MPRTSRSSSDSGSARSSRSSNDRRPNSLGFHSTSVLILVPEVEDQPHDYPFSDEDDDDDASSPFEPTNSPAITPLPTPLVFLYFLSPCLKLGAMLFLDNKLPLKFAVPALVVSAFLSAFARQIWFLLARYVRKADLADIVSEAVARGPRNDGRRKRIRSTVRCGSAVLRVLLASVYWRETTDVLLPHVPERLVFLPAKIVLSVILALPLAPLCLAASLASKRVIYTTWLSIGLYVVWMSFVAFAHAKGLLGTDAFLNSPGSLWQGVSTIAFAFSTTNTLYLYSSLIGTASPGSAKAKRIQSASSISALGTVIGVLLIIPLIFLRRGYDVPDQSQDDWSASVQALIATFTSFPLALAIPPVIVTAPALPVPPAARPYSKLLLLGLAFAISSVPANLFSVLGNVVLGMALSSTYFLPALVHIVHHQLRRPLSIVIPPSTPSVGVVTTPTHDPSTNELLRRKEHALQRHRLGRRILWDIGVWVLLIPIGGGGFGWALWCLLWKE